MQRREAPEVLGPARSFQRSGVDVQRRQWQQWQQRQQWQQQQQMQGQTGSESVEAKPYVKDGVGCGSSIAVDPHSPMRDVS